MRIAAQATISVATSESIMPSGESGVRPFTKLVILAGQNRLLERRRIEQGSTTCTKPDS